jgi:hypothetical protein
LSHSLSIVDSSFNIKLLNFDSPVNDLIDYDRR